MAVIKDSELDEIERNINLMEYKPGENYDDWYPSMDEIDLYLKKGSKQDIMFLLWLLNPGMKLTEDQEMVRKQIRKKLYNPKYLTVDLEEKNN